MEPQPEYIRRGLQLSDLGFGIRGAFGFTSTPITTALGTSSCSNSSCFDAS